MKNLALPIHKIKNKIFKVIGIAQFIFKFNIKGTKIVIKVMLIVLILKQIFSNLKIFFCIVSNVYFLISQSSTLIYYQTISLKPLEFEFIVKL